MAFCFGSATYAFPLFLSFSPPQTICLNDGREKYLTNLRGWRAALRHLEDFSSLGSPTLGPRQKSWLRNGDIAKDMSLMDFDEEKIWSRSILGVDRASRFSNFAYTPAAFAISRVQRAMES